MAWVVLEAPVARGAVVARCERTEFEETREAVYEAQTATGRRVPGFLHGYNALAALLVLFQAFHGMAVALVYKYADAIVKNFANSSAAKRVAGVGPRGAAASGAAASPGDV